MATYGKKKRSMLSGFSVFRDDQPAPNPKLESTSEPIVLRFGGTLLIYHLVLNPSRLGRAKSALQNSNSRQIMDSDSADELAGDSLLNHQAQQPTRSSLQSDAATSEHSKTKSTRTTAEDRNKPLPPIPASQPSGDLFNTSTTRSVLMSKSTNFKISRKAENLPARPKISNPVLQDSEDNDHNSALRAIEGTVGRKNTTGLQTTIEEAENLSRKISTLMQQAAAREAEKASQLKELSMTASNKASPLQKSKRALSKATQALTSRFSNSGRRPSTSKARQSESSSSVLVGFEYPGEPKTSLSNIQRGDITAASGIPRKPLPVYDSMRSVRQSSDPLQDPFSDGHRIAGHPSPEIHVEFDFDFDKHKRKGRKPNEDQAVSHPTTFNDDTMPSGSAQHPSRFSNKISGLAQHPNTMIFSSPPIGFSTPSSRLYPPLGSLDASSLASNMAQTPSILEFSFEESDEDDVAELKNSRPTDQSLSVKRKNAKEDLRAQLSPLSKRARKGRDTPTDEKGLMSETNHPDSEQGGPLIKNHESTKSSRPATADSKINGPGMMEAVMEKGPLSVIGEKFKRPRARTTAAKRLSIPTPNSILFSRESRAHYRLRDTTDGDSFDVDELQIDDGGYKVRAVRKS